MDDTDTIVEAALALGPQIRAAADEIEQGRRLPLPLVQAMKEAGVFRMTMPRAWGGPEADRRTGATRPARSRASVAAACNTSGGRSFTSIGVGLLA